MEPLKCKRCAGSLVEETISDPKSEEWDYYSDVLRCINCGDITDPVIEANRRASTQTQAQTIYASTRPRRPLWRKAVRVMQARDDDDAERIKLDWPNDNLV